MGSSSVDVGCAADRLHDLLDRDAQAVLAARQRQRQIGHFGERDPFAPGKRIVGRADEEMFLLRQRLGAQHVALERVVVDDAEIEPAA